MYCDACGRELQPGQNFCPSCGKALGGPVHLTAPSRIAEHIRVLGILWIVYSLLSVLGGIALFFVANFIFGAMARGGEFPPGAPPFLRPMLTAIGWVILIKGLAGVAAGWGLLEREEWARPLALVISFISLLNIPIGTAIGIYSLWALLYADADRDYRALVAKA